MSLLKCVIAAVTVQHVLSANLPKTTDCWQNNKGCFLYPENCRSDGVVSNCDYIVTFKASSRTIDFSLATNTTAAEFPEDAYVAVGFSPSGKMAGSLMTACLYDGVNGQFQLGKVEGEHHFVRIEQRSLEKQVIRFGVAKQVNGYLVCNFRQLIRPDTNSTEVPRLDVPHYLLVASGFANFSDPLNPVAEYHTPARHHNTNERINLRGENPLALPNTTECGQDGKGCFVYPDNCKSDATKTDCEYIVTFKQIDQTKTVEFVLATNATAEVQDSSYVGVGFSPKGKMEGSKITACLFDGNKAHVHLGHVEGEHHYVRNDNTQPEVTVISRSEAAIIDGYLICRFRQEILPAPAANAELADLSIPQYLLVASGFANFTDVKAPVATYHTPTRHHNTKERVNVSGASVLTCSILTVVLATLLNLVR